MPARKSYNNPIEVFAMCIDVVKCCSWKDHVSTKMGRVYYPNSDLWHNAADILLG